MPRSMRPNKRVHKGYKRVLQLVRYAVTACSFAGRGRAMEQNERRIFNGGSWFHKRKQRIDVALAVIHIRAAPVGR